MSTQTQLLFVYNADSGAFNTLADIGHKIFSPGTYSCALCAITHSIFREKEQWRSFVASLPVECIFLHRNKFLHQHPGFQGQLPGVFLHTTGRLTPCLSAEQLKSCHDMQDLQQLIYTHCINEPEESSR